jgi:hypothetical protein
VREGMTAEQALNGSAWRFGVSPSELRRIWLEKCVEVERARNLRAAGE